MSGDLARLRSLRGMTSAVWAGSALRSDPGRWSALTGANSADFNLIVCHEASDGRAFPQALEDIAAVKAPGMVMAAGGALSEVQQLARASWVCVGALPFLQLDLSTFAANEADDGVRRLQGSEVPEARALLSDAFGMSAEVAHTALPDATATTPGMSVWAAWTPEGRMASCLATVHVEDIVGGWSLTTARENQQQGYGRRVLRTALIAARANGARRYIGNSSPAALPLFTSLGFTVLEHWQIWSRARWVMSRF